MEEHKKEHHGQTEEVVQGKAIAMSSYLCLPALFSYFAGDKKNKFARFHAIQGINLLILGIAAGIICAILMTIGGAIACHDAYSCLNTALGGGGIIWVFMLITWVVGIVFTVIEIIGIVYAYKGLEKEVPILGKIKIVKK